MLDLVLWISRGDAWGYFGACTLTELEFLRERKCKIGSKTLESDGVIYKKSS